MKPTALYRHYDKDDNLLYIGISHSLMQRVCSHTQHSNWILKSAKMSIEWFDNRYIARHAERLAIKAEKPMFNKDHNHSSINYRDFDKCRDLLFNWEDSRDSLIYRNSLDELSNLICSKYRLDEIEKFEVTVVRFSTRPLKQMNRLFKEMQGFKSRNGKIIKGYLKILNARYRERKNSGLSDVTAGHGYLNCSKDTDDNYIVHFDMILYSGKKLKIHKLDREWLQIAGADAKLEVLDTNSNMSNFLDIVSSEHSLLPVRDGLIWEDLTKGKNLVRTWVS